MVIRAFDIHQGSPQDFIKALGSSYSAVFIRYL